MDGNEILKSQTSLDHLSTAPNLAVINRHVNSCCKNYILTSAIFFFIPMVCLSISEQFHEVEPQHLGT